MKIPAKIILPVLVLSTLLLSACSGVAALSNSSAGSKVEAAPIEFTGIIQAMNGNQWVVDGQTITIDPSILKDGAFSLGDTVKVQAQTGPDGSITVTQIEIETEADPQATEIAGTPDPTNGGLVIGKDGTEAFGTVDSISADGIVIAGQTFTLASDAELKDAIKAGDFVKVHFTLNADGTMSITQIELSDPTQIGNDSSGEGLDDNNTSGADDNGNDGSETENKDKSNSGGDVSGSGGGDD